MKRIIFISLIIFSCMNSCNKQSSEAKELVPNAPYVALTGDELKIVAEITLKPDVNEVMKPIFEKVVAGSQAEEGCIYYDLHQDISDTTNTKYVMVEIWKNQAAIDIHNESPHFKTFKQASADYIDHMRVLVLKVSK